MKGSSIANTSDRPSHVFKSRLAVPTVLIAFVPEGATTVDRCPVETSFTIGRRSKCDLSINDDKVSGSHLRITRTEESFWIEDLGSTNGTFLNGYPVKKRQQLPSSSVIRVGRAVLVFHTNGEAFLDLPPLERFGIAGRFHTSSLLRDLREAALSYRHVLLVGPSGTGKELAAQALTSIMESGGKPLSMLAHNAARFTSEEEATSTLFGVAPRIFSNVDARPGLIEQANGGAFFLDEVHNLPLRVQRSLLRVIEDGEVARIGETKTRPAQVHFILASNAPGPSFSLAPDLLARLRVVKVPSLKNRVADVPTIFNSVLRSALSKRGIAEETVMPLLRADHYEALCLDGFSDDNVRGLIDLADRLVTRIRIGTDPLQAVISVFYERFGHGLVAHRPSKDGTEKSSSSHYERNKELIIAAYKQCGGNLSAVERLLRSRGIRCSRRWLAIFIERWGIT